MTEETRQNIWGVSFGMMIFVFLNFCWDYARATKNGVAAIAVLAATVVSLKRWFEYAFACRNYQEETEV